jgi:hypothetical protein
MRKLKKIWIVINDYLGNILEDILKIDILNYIIKYTLIVLLILTSVFSAYHLGSDLILHFNHPYDDNHFPFVLEFSENLFLYFLPIFVLFGFLKYYEYDLERYITKSPSIPDENAEEQLHLSKKLFFSSVLSYITIKIIEKIFFDFDSLTENNEYYLVELISIGVFYILLITFVLIKNSAHPKPKKDEE